MADKRVRPHYQYRFGADYGNGIAYNIEISGPLNAQVLRHIMEIIGITADALENDETRANEAPSPSLPETP